MITVEQINELLPQTQCGQCGFKGCMPYAEAIFEGRADINQCPPGGDEGVVELAALLKREAKPLNAAHGQHKSGQVAYIRESECIGCVKCLAVCPVDAIVGAAKLMHTVIASECTGCELCLSPCPVDCIEMRPLVRMPTREEKIAQRQKAKRRYEARNLRLAAIAYEKAERIRKQKQALLEGGLLLK